MQHFKVVVFALLVAQGVFQGEGLPAGDNENKKKFNLKCALLCGSSGESEKSTTNRCGLTIKPDGTVNGLGLNTKFTVSNLKEPLQAVTPQTFYQALHTSTHNHEPILIVSNIFIDLLSAQSENPQNAAMNYETAVIFLQMFDTLPRETIAAMKIVSFLIKRKKEMNANKKKFNFENELSEATKTFGDVRFIIWSYIESRLSNAVRGKLTELKEIVDCVTDTARRIPPFGHIEWGAFEEVVDEVADLAKLIRSI